MQKIRDIPRSFPVTIVTAMFSPPPPPGYLAFGILAPRQLFCRRLSATAGLNKV
jgi:hypothetical protein